MTHPPPALKIGPFAVDPPVVLAPMGGLHMIMFDPDEYPRSMQIYGVDPRTIGTRCG